MTDVLRSVIRSKLRDLGYRQVNVAEDAWIAWANEQSYHPVKEFLEALEWDGQDHIGKLSDFVDDEHGDFETFFRRWAIGAVARACEPHSCQNRMLILDGEQEIGKSYFVHWLASPLSDERPEFFIEGAINPDDKDSLVRLIGTWIWEVSEVGSTVRRSDRDSLKYFLSMQQVTVRKPYGRYDLVKPALANFIGTVNNTAGFLDDPTGSRRFMAVHVTHLNWDYAEVVDPEQVWAQAKALYDAGEPWMLRPKEKIEVNKVNELYEIVDPLEDMLFRIYEKTGQPGDFAATVDIRKALNYAGWSLSTPRGEAIAIGDAMKRNKINSARRTVAGNQERGYVGIREKRACLPT
jgi:putative DNA primase/helicase